MSPLSLVAFGRRTISYMQPLSMFATPAVSYADMETACARLSAAWTNRNMGEVGAQELIDAMADLDRLLHLQATFVDTKALGSVTIIVSSGFDHTAEAGVPVTRPDAPSAPELTPLGAGGLDTKVLHQNKVTHNVFVVFKGDAFALPVVNNQIVIPAGSVGVVIMPIAHTHEHLSGFTGGEKVTVVAFSFNAGGLSDASNPTTTFIL